jgi:Flp pilus assembly protein TadG
MARLTRLRTFKERSQRGIALLEAAIVFPLLILLTFGLMEYGWLFLNCQHITNAARQGARTGVRPDATNAEVQAAVRSILNSVGIEDGQYTVTFSPSNVATPNPGDTLTVTVTVPYENITLTGAPLIPVPATLRSAITMAKEGP